MRGPVIHVVEDDDAVRASLMRLLSYAGFGTRGYASAGEFLAADEANRPCCLVLDLGLPGLSGMELQAALAKRADSPPIVFLTGRGDIHTSVRAMKAGAVDFLVKPISQEALLSAVREAVARDSRDLARQSDLKVLRSRLSELTPREREVFARVVRGKLNKQIADELGISIRTIKAHRAQVMSKMEVGTLAELVSCAALLDIDAHA